MPSLSLIRVVATAVVLVVFIAVAVVSLGASGRPTYWFPAFIGVGGTLAAAYAFARDLREVLAGRSVVEGEVIDLGASVSDTHDEDGKSDEAAALIRKRMLAWTLWLISLPLLALVVPFFYASLMWLVAVLRFYAKRSWLAIAVSVGAFAVVLNVLVVMLDIRLPSTVLTAWG